MVQHLKHAPLSSLCFACPRLPDRSHQRFFSLVTFLKQFFLLCFEFPGILLQFCLCLCMYLCSSAQAEVRGQYMRDSSLLPLWGTQGSNAGHHTWPPLPSGPSRQPRFPSFAVILYFNVFCLIFGAFFQSFILSLGQVFSARGNFAPMMKSAKSKDLMWWSQLGAVVSSQGTLLSALRQASPLLNAPRLLSSHEPSTAQTLVMLKPEPCSGLLIQPFFSSGKST